MPKIATKVMLGHSLKEQGYQAGEAPRRRPLVCQSACVQLLQAPAAPDAYLSPEMKSTGEAIGYDDSLNRALYKALQASNMRVANYGTVFVTIADEDKRRGAAPGAPVLSTWASTSKPPGAPLNSSKTHGIRTRSRAKISEGSEEILESLRQGHVSVCDQHLGRINSSGPTPTALPSAAAPWRTT